MGRGFYELNFILAVLLKMYGSHYFIFGIEKLNFISIN